METLLSYVKTIIKFIKDILKILEIAIPVDVSNMLDKIENMEIPALY